MKKLPGRKQLAQAGVTLALAGAMLTSGASNVAHAHSGHDISSKPALSFVNKLFIKGTGRAILHGSVESVSTNSFNLKSWGGTWTVTTDSDTKFSLKGGSSTVVVGDTVVVRGKVSTTSNMTVLASAVESKGAKKVAQENKKEAHKFWKNISKQNDDAIRGAGTVEAVGSSSLTVSGKNGVDRTINIGAATKFFSKNWLPLSLSDIKVGNVIKAFGTSTNDTTLNAVLIHDLSI